MAMKEEKTYLYKGKPIPIGRIDVADKGARALMEKERLAFNELPVVLIGFDKNLYQHYDASSDFGGFLHHLNRVMEPVPLL